MLPIDDNAKADDENAVNAPTVVNNGRKNEFIVPVDTIGLWNRNAMLMSFVVKGENPIKTHLGTIK